MHNPPVKVEVGVGTHGCIKQASVGERVSPRSGESSPKGFIVPSLQAGRTAPTLAVLRLRRLPLKEKGNRLFPLFFASCNLPYLSAAVHAVFRLMAGTGISRIPADFFNSMDGLILM